MKKMVLVLSIGLMVLGCASLPETMKKRDDAEKSIIGVSVVTKAPIAIFKDVNTRVFFIKVEKKDQMFKGTDLRAGNFQKGNYVYLVNAEPGMYVVVASNFEKKGQVYHTYFNKEAISATLMEVRPADIAFMGEITTRNEASLSGIFLNNIGKRRMRHRSIIIRYSIQWGLSIWVSFTAENSRVEMSMRRFSKGSSTTRVKFSSNPNGRI